MATLALSIGSSAFGQSPQTINGDQNWVVPDGVTTVTVQAWGGGGGGGSETGVGSSGAGGGGGGAYYSRSVTVVPGATHSVTIGFGGFGANPGGQNGGIGGTTTFAHGSTPVSASGGWGGQPNAGGIGGFSIAPGPGFINRSGGSGGNPTASNGGGGGGSAGFGGVGGSGNMNGSGGAAGAAGAGAAGAAGGAGGANFFSPGSNGGTPGAGGGGSGRGSSVAGGRGAAGRVILTWTAPPANSDPTDIALNATSVAENQPIGTTVATISGTDPDAGQSGTLTFSLVSGAGSTDNASFTVVGTALNTTAIFDFETKSSYSIRLRATDTGIPELTYDEVFTITVTDANEMPGFTKGANPSIANTTAAQSVSGWATAIDDGDSTVTQTLSFTVTEVGSSGLFTTAPSIDSSTGTLSYRPNGMAGTATFSVTLTDDASINSAAALTTSVQTFTITVAVPAPTVTSVAPVIGSTAGGESVTITGTDFAGVTSVTFDGLAAPLTATTNTSLQVTTPPHAAGPVSVIVTTPGGTNAANTAFTYEAPSITVPGGVTTLSTTISGTPGTPAVAISISAAFLSPQSGNLTATAPANVNISINGTTWTTAGSPSVSIPYTGGTLTAYTLFARLAGTGTPGAISGDISISGGGAATEQQTVFGTLNTAPGDLDFTFNGTGKVTTAVGTGSEGASGVVVQSDGKILVAGSAVGGGFTDFALVRYNSDATLDTAFGTGGKVTTAIGTQGDIGNDVALQADGKIIVVGSANDSSNRDFAVVRYNTDGTLDTTFGIGGRVRTPVGAFDEEVHSVAVQSDGAIVVAGYTWNGTNNDFALVRYTSTGALDTTFGTGGIVTTAVGASSDIALSVTLQSNGAILVAGASIIGGNSDFALVRYTTTGALDTTFGNGGKVTTAFVNDDAAFCVKVQSDGAILLAGSTGSGIAYDIALARYTSTGVLDSTFGTGGQVTTPIGPRGEFGRGLAVQRNGKIVVGGYSHNGTNDDFAVVRYTSTGALDTTFGTGGKKTTAIGSGEERGLSVALQSDGAIVVAGYSFNGNNNDIAVVRYVGDVPPADYTVATTSNAIVVTDNFGNGDVLTVSQPSAGNIRFAAPGRTFSVDGGVFITGNSGDLSRTNVTSITVNAAAGNDTINIGAFTGTLPSLTVNGDADADTVNLNGDVTFTAGAGLSVTSETLTLAAGVDMTTSGAGTIMISADDMVIASTGTLVSSSTVNLKPQTAAWEIDLGTNTAGKLGLTDTELDRVTAGTLIVGDAACGQITLSAAISPAGTTTLSLITGAGVTQATTAAKITETNLAVRAVNSVSLDQGFNGRHAVSTLAARSTGGGIGFRSSLTLTVGTVDGLNGLNAGAGGALAYADTGNVIIQQPIVATGGVFLQAWATGALLDISADVTSGGSVLLGGDRMIINNPVAATTDCSVFGSAALDLGSATDAAAATTELSDAELDFITISTPGGILNLQTNGDIVVSAALTLGSKKLRLSTSVGTIDFNGGSITTTSDIDLYGEFVTADASGTDVTANKIFSFAKTFGTAANPLRTTVGNLSIDQFQGGGGVRTGIYILETDSVSLTNNGLKSTNAPISLTTSSGSITLSFADVATTGTVSLIAGGAGGTLSVSGDDISGSAVSLTADNMTIGSTATITASTGAVDLAPITPGRPIDLGTNTASQLGLTDAELDRITASTLVIGDANSGAITISAAISPAAYRLLDIQKGVTFSAAGGFDSEVTSASVYEKIKANGAVVINAASTLTATAIGGFVPAAVDAFTLIENVSASGTTGTFTGKLEGTIVAVGGVNKKLTYLGGTGNDVVLQSASPTVTASTADLASNATTVTINGTNFDTTPGNNTVVFSNGAVGTVTVATATSLTVDLITAPTSGSLTAVVTTNGVSSGSAVQIATVINIYRVNVLTDASGTALGSGSGFTGDLRYCVAQSNANGGGFITFDPGLTGTISLALAGANTTFGPSALVVTAETSIDGNNGAAGITITSAVSGASTSLRLFFVAATGKLTIKNLTLSGGLAKGFTGGGGWQRGGGGGGSAGFGGAIFNQGTLVLENDTLTGNQAVGGDGSPVAGSTAGSGGGGGGLSAVGGNGGAQAVGGAGGGPNGGAAGTGTGAGAAGGIGGGGGGGGTGLAGAGSGAGGGGGFGGGGGGGGAYQRNGGSGGIGGLGGTGGFGGGGGGAGDGTPSGVVGAAGFGGGAGGAGSGTGNIGSVGGAGAGMGGAVFNSGGVIVATNTTFQANTATGGAATTYNGRSSGSGSGLGGSIFNRNGALTLNNVTMSGNTAAQGGRGVYNLGDAATATAVVNNTIIGQADTTVSDFVGNAINGGTNTTSGAGNLIRTLSGFSGTLASTADPILTALASNGGPTKTMSLGTGSPAIDAGSNALASAFTTDQRGTGFLRVIQGNPLSASPLVDIGAFENPVPPTVASISPTSGSTAGGTSVTITGTNFGGTPSVTIGGNPATSVVVNSDTSITCTTPVGAAGAKDVVVSVFGQASTGGTGLFTYIVPYNVALGKPVIRVSSEYNPFSGFVFSASKVTDGSTSDSFGNNYWITPDGQGIGAYFTLDLQGVFNLTEIRLRNTSNTQHNDRGTGGFRILASNYVDGSNQLISPQTILTGTLTQGSGTLVSFTTSNGFTAGNYRYLRFIVDSLAPWAVGTGSAGLNEIEAYGVPSVAGPTVSPSTANLVINSTTLTIMGAGFSTTPGDNTVAFSPAGTGTVTASAATSLTVTGITGLTAGALNAVVTTNSLSSGAPVQVATVIPPLSNNANLANLVLTTATLNPGFSSGITSYNATVPNATLSVTATPTVTQAGATVQVRVNGGAYSSVASTFPSGPLALLPGPNPIDVRVTAQNGTTTLLYTVVVTRTATSPVSSAVGDVVTANDAPDETGANSGLKFDVLRRGGYLSEDGKLVFPGYLLNVGGPAISGVWKDDGSGLKLLALTGNNAAQTGTTLATYDVLPQTPAINDSGEVTFLASLAVGSGVAVTTVATDTALWSEVGGAGLSILMRESDSVPTIAGASIGAFASGCFATAHTSGTTGEAAFAITMKGTTTDTAILRASVSSTTTAVQVVARENTATGVGSENFGNLAGGYTDALRMDATGNLAFVALTKPSARESLWYQPAAPAGGAPVKVFMAGTAATGDVAPGTGGATFKNIKSPTIGGGGVISFRGQLNLNGDNATNLKNDGIWRGTGSDAVNYQCILRRGDDNTNRVGFGLPAGAKVGNLWGGWLTNANRGAWRGWLDVNGNGVSSTADGDVNAIYSDLSGVMRYVVRVGGVDDAPGMPAGAKFAAFDLPVVGGAEQVVFLGNVTGGGTTAANNSGIWRSAPNGGALALVVRTGDVITTTQGAKTIRKVDFPASEMTDRRWEQPIMDSTGRLIVFVTFTDGTTSHLIVP